MAEEIGVAVIGSGVIGRTHVETLCRTPGLALTAICDPDPGARALADATGARYFDSVDDLIASRMADAAVVAASNAAHLPLGRALLQAGLPVLMEKPLTSTLAEAEELAGIVEATGVPLLVGHHRRHNPIIRAAKATIAAGEIGELVSATVMSVLSKPDDYFAGWRIEPGEGGPLLINTTHEVDLLRHFFGEVDAVSAVVSGARRGLPVEDTAAVVLTFAAGGIATISQTDAACGPWAWDMTAGENRARFPAHDTIAHAYAGTRAALSLPDLTLWRHPATPDWTTEMVRRRVPHAPGDAYVAQLAHFGAVVRGETAPILTAADAMETMRVIEAIRRAAAERRHVVVTEVRA